MLLSTAYFPPVSWFAAAARDFTLSSDRVLPSVVLLEACENYQKQSWRNRCAIAAASGVEIYSVPVVHEGGSFRHPVKEIRIDYSTAWVERFWRAVCSAYENSAFFEYYRDEIAAILFSRPERLWDLNLSLIHYFLDKCGIQARIEETASYLPPGASPDDLRDAIHPKRKDTVLDSLGLSGRPYHQVFSGNYPFKENLSVMDLLFNEGPDCLYWLKSL